MNSLPDLALIEVFKLLDRDSLMNASNVNQRWNFIINSCSALMDRFELDLVVQQRTCVDDALEESKRLKHRRLILRSNGDDIHRVQKRFIMEIIDNCRVTDLCLLMIPRNFQNQILSNLSFVTSLRVDGFFIHLAHHKIFDFPNLKYLNAIDGESFLNCIGENRIETLKISFIKSYISGALERLNYLKHLSIFGFYWRSDRAFDTFKLKTLTLAVTNGAHKPALEWSLRSGRKFLESQKGSLKELFIEYDDDHMVSCDDLLTYAFNDLNLRKLYTLYNIRESKGIHKVNEQLKELTIELKKSNITEDIIACCPGVEKLDLSHTEMLFEYMLPLVSMHMKFLRELKLNIIRPDYFERVDVINAKLDNLLSLDVNLDYNSEFHHLTKVVACTPNLKQLKIFMKGPMQWNVSDFRKFLTAISSVEEIYCFGDFGLNDLTSDILMDSLSQLKLRSLKIKVQHPEKYEHLKEMLLNTKVRLVIMKTFPYFY